MTLNEAIYTVLTTQYKKDAKEAHKIVENAGYTINKCSGHFEVTNPKNNRYVRINRDYYSYRYHCGMANVWCGTRCSEMRYERLERIDYVNLLNTSYNKEYYRKPKWKVTNQNRKDKLYNSKWDVKFYNDRVEIAKHNIERAQQELIKAVENKAKAVQKLEEVRTTIKRR